MVQEKHERIEIFESMLPLGDIVLDPILQHIDDLLNQMPKITEEIKSVF